MTILKTLLVSAALAAAAAMPAQAGSGVSVPVQFQGTWFDADSPRRIGSDSIEIGRLPWPPCDIISAKSDSTMPETTISIAWKCPGSGWPTVEVVWKLDNVGGREVMMQINVQQPTVSSLLQRTPH